MNLETCGIPKAQSAHSWQGLSKEKHGKPAKMAMSIQGHKTALLIVVWADTALLHSLNEAF